ncbi:MAG TPA: vanadium-dependent haloperoxidase [Pyrinomonadaceae bacterium]|nr:vanadium-dependent haloperoxidase [Pyrinomonadaceae bacterium]
MKHKQLITGLLTLAILFCTQIHAWALNSNSQEDVILQWNRVLMETIRTPGQHPATIMPVRSYAIMHAAMFDAVNSIDGSHTPYLTDVPGSQNASLEAAAAQGAHDVLAGLYPTRLAVFDAELAISLQGIEPDRAQQGIRVGQIVAERLLAARANDGWTVTPPSYSLPATPGNWQPTPPSNAAAQFTHYPSVLPFAISSKDQFAPNSAPAMTSAQYANDLNEVKEIGSVNSLTRTADQTKVAQLWAGVNTPTNFLFVWNNVARSVAEARGITTVEKARLFALINISLHDSLQTTFAAKFQYGVWRPVTAIRRADEDGNTNTTPDPAWSSLVGSPPYPSYPGNMAGIGTSQSTMLALFFGRDDIAFQHTWEGAGGATRSYTSFGAMADEEARARVYGGIHFTFDNVAGQSVGTNVANYIFANVMRPRQCVR